jgi:hypothetical protein
MYYLFSQNVVRTRIYGCYLKYIACKYVHMIKKLWVCTYVTYMLVLC